MLPDLERKLLRIIYNFWTQRRRVPTMKELERTTGRPQRDIVATLHNLERNQYIQWPDKSTLHSIRLLHVSTPVQKPMVRERRGLRSDIEYWTDY